MSEGTEDFEAIVRRLGQYEFAWDIERALEFALFRTYAVPSISGLLVRTGKFEQSSRKRYDDTELLLAEAGENGLESERGRAAVDRINAIHGRFHIANDDMLYVLSTFVLEPIRWIEKNGHRALTPEEALAWTAYYQELGRRMGIVDIPETLAGFEMMNLRIESERFEPAESNRRIGDATLNLMLGFYLPRFLFSIGRPVALCLMDDALLNAMRYETPPRWLKAMVMRGMRLRAWVLRRLPPRRKPVLITRRRSATYPGGYVIEQLGNGPVGNAAE